MTAVKKFLAGGAVVAALVAATPASAQYMPGYGGGDIISQVIGGIIGGGGYGSPYGSGYGYGSPYGGYGSPYGYGMGYGSPYGGGYGSPYGGGYGSPYGGGYGNRGYGQTNSYAVGQCMGAVQQRLGATYGQTQYGGGARVLGVSDVQPRNNGGMLVSGVANSGRSGGYGYNGGQPPVDITFTCKTDRSGQVSSIEIGQATANVDPRIGTAPASPYANDYSEYGYRRY